MPHTDPFTILGLSSGASRDDVKRAYRKLAMHWHPDRNPTKAAEERFKHIKAAYELAIDEQAYAIWRAERPVERTTERPAAPPAKDSQTPIVQALHLSLEEAALGCRQHITVDRVSPCPPCKGSGKITREHSMACSHCNGVGRLRRTHEHCPHCNGRGYVRETDCTDCNGTGEQILQKVFDVKIPPGLRDGEILRLPSAEGNIHLEIHHRPHPLFTLQGDDIHCVIPLNVLCLIAGGTIEVPTLQGKMPLEIKANTSSDEIRLSRLGFPARKGHAAGDLCLKLHAIFPQGLSAAEQALLRQLNASIDKHLATRLPEVHTWQDRLNKRANEKTDS